MRRASRFGALIAAALSLLSSAAAAHKMKLFAAAEGTEISGHAYFSGGGRAQDAAVIARGPDGATLFSGRTDAEGGFRFRLPAEAPPPAQLELSVEGDDGHRAAFVLTLDPSPIASAPTPAPMPAVIAPPSSAASPAFLAAPPAAPPPSATLVGIEPTALAALVEQATARQIRPLREQLDAFEDRARLHDVLGGVGVIFGLGGVAYGLSVRARLRRRQEPGERP